MAWLQLDKRAGSWLKVTIVSSIIAAFLLMLANSAFWVNRYLFNTESFTGVATTSLTSESSRQAIARRITNEALKDRPIINNVAGDTATNVISGALNTDLANKALDTVVSKMQVLVTTEQREPVVINLEGVKTFLDEVIQVAGKYRNVQVDTGNIPSEIVLIDQSNIPNFYKWSVFFLWLGPIALLIAIALFAYPYFVNKLRYKQILLAQGVFVILAGLFALLLGPLFRPQILSNFTNPEGRVVVENLFNAFLAPFNSQTMVVIIFGLLASLAGGGLMLLGKLRQTK
jgi:hypothetical protein